MRSINVPINSIDSVKIFSPSQKGIYITTRPYSSEECSLFLGNDYLGKGVIPVEISIRNSSDRTYALSAASVPIALYRGKDLAWKQTKKSFPRSMAFRIAGFFFWPIMIPSTIDGIITFKNHRSLSRDLEGKTLKEEEELILPYSTVTRILYAKESSYYSNFSVALKDEASEELTVIPVSP